ncbi:unnamed protein product [Rotaria sp. Silwood1]|nr:unnamed protein product [Rotaria sp. Silwood1]CAF1641133.1 unnamed protein product [Rotaria sp. Silwood1]CAF3891209.1 unnamed protein product [Rotaria sp. Silwood1]
MTNAKLSIPDVNGVCEHKLGGEWNRFWFRNLKFAWKECQTKNELWTDYDWNSAPGFHGGSSTWWVDGDGNDIKCWFVGGWSDGSIWKLYDNSPNC